MTSEERKLLKRMDAGELDGMVGDRWKKQKTNDSFISVF